MHKEGAVLRDIVLMQKRELEQRLAEPYVEREVEVPRAMRDLICVILGPRRAGKSLFAMHHVRALGKPGYVNFDDERLVRLDDFDGLVAAVDSVYSHPRHLLLDEIQNVPRWELLVNRLQRQGYRLTLTGSNARLLGSELATHLTGRHYPVVIFPFSFPEYLKATGGDRTDAEKADAFRTYAEVGGYPEPLVKGMPYREYLTTLLRSTLYKDVVVRHRVRAPQGLEDMAGFLMANVAQRHSYNRLAGLAGVSSAHTVQKYARHLEESFLFFSLPRFSFSVREQVRAPRKVYCTDNGMVTSTAFQLGPNAGRLYENLVAARLRRREMEGKLQLFYWQGAAQEEVDFAVKKGPRVAQLIQVCLDVSSSATWAREVRALLKAGHAVGCRDLLVLTDIDEGEREVSWYGLRGTVRLLPLWKWASQEG